VPALEKRDEQNPEPRRNLAVHSFLPFQVNTTLPVGVPTRDLTVADSLTVLPTNALAGLADTVVVVMCLRTMAAEALAALAWRANRAPVAVTTAAPDSSRVNLILKFPPISVGYAASAAMGLPRGHVFVKWTLSAALRITYRSTTC
jgi:hypothetical protein